MKEKESHTLLRRGICCTRKLLVISPCMLTAPLQILLLQHRSKEACMKTKCPSTSRSRRLILTRWNILRSRAQGPGGFARGAPNMAALGRDQRGFAQDNIILK